MNIDELLKKREEALEELVKFDKAIAELGKDGTFITISYEVNGTSIPQCKCVRLDYLLDGLKYSDEFENISKIVTDKVYLVNKLLEEMFNCEIEVLSLEDGIKHIPEWFVEAISLKIKS